MKLEKRTPSGREKDEAAIELLNKLRDRVFSDNVSAARLAAFNLSWMQEDGLDILKEILFGDFPRTAKKAAAYGLRSMKGRMRKMASDALTAGLKHSDRVTRDACAKALFIMAGGQPPKPAFRPKHKPNKGRIREFRNKKGGAKAPSPWKRSSSGRQ
ncbi:MAG: hypothetical protein RBS72_19415 [Sedimentisphaerales bacterium]|jgi:hypothetical protein|nr:hypothetical protein [Sedimentisphaerales bacterium]NLZ05875.1 hypothetical protein [Phycisphaerae bacterium]HNY80070.1 hypothetical protein [Sedimentisphaerales bacterium]HOC64953.1 hypothetical protein [Sedimentisphaerales bacterium]HOH65879.1 hypothetical protein [Sedimentisphaerales bacterium]